MKVAIIGGRDFNNYEMLCEILNQYKNKISQIISGGAKGADSLGERWAKDKKIQTKIFYPDWGKYGKTAGLVRNHDIISNSDCVIAFWDGKSTGTKHSISLCKESKKPIKIIYYE